MNNEIENFFARGNDYWLTRFVILRLLGFVYVIAFLVAVNQLVPLSGATGLTPAHDFLSRVHSHYGSRTEGMLHMPTFFWFGVSDLGLSIIAWVGLVLSLIVAPRAVVAAPIVGSAPPVAPRRESITGAAPGASQVPRPPATVLSRRLVSKAGAPPAIVPFIARQQVLNAHPGRPLDRATLASLRGSPSGNLRPAFVSATAAGANTLRPARAGLADTHAAQPSVQAVRAADEAINEPRSAERFNGVAARDAQRSRDISSGRGVNQKRADKNSRPRPVTEKE